MARRCFFSFHYDLDNWRASKIRNIGVIEGNRPATDNDWEEVLRGKDLAIKNWIVQQMRGRTCTVVLIGEQTANRKWINYEIETSWKLGMGVVGIYIHNLKDANGRQAQKGANPFDFVIHPPSKRRFSFIVKAYDPPRTSGKGVYKYIAENIEGWIEEAIQIRKMYP